MNRFGNLKMVLFFLAGALGPLITQIGTKTQWEDLAGPYYVLGTVYTGTVTLIAYVMQSPINLQEAFAKIPILSQEKTEESPQ